MVTVVVLLGFGRLSAAEPLPDGRQLARAIRELFPEKSAETPATMEVIERERKRNKTSVVIRIDKMDKAHWSLTCLAKREGAVDDQWRVHHALGRANKYEHNGTLPRAIKSTPAWLVPHLRSPTLGWISFIGQANPS